MSTGRFGWYELMTHEPAKAREFYAKLFGWGVKEEKMGEGYTYHTIVNGECQLGGYVEDNQSPANSPAHWVSCVNVKDVDATIKTAKKQGAKTLMGPMDLGENGRYAVLADAQGAVFSIHSAKAGAPEMPTCAENENTFVWTELSTNNPAAAKKFYGAIGGWTFDRFESMGNDEYWIAKSEGQGFAGIWKMKPAAEGGPPAPMWTPYVSVSDPDAILAKAKELGGRILMEATDAPKVGRFAVLADPYGGVIGILRPEPGMEM